MNDNKTPNKTLTTLRSPYNSPPFVTLTIIASLFSYLMTEIEVISLEEHPSVKERQQTRSIKSVRTSQVDVIFKIKL